MQQYVATGIFKYLKLRLFVIGREECGVFVTNTERQLQIIFNAVPVVTEPNFRSETCQLKMNKQLRLWTSCTFWQQLHSRVHSWNRMESFFSSICIQCTIHKQCDITIGWPCRRPGSFSAPQVPQWCSLQGQHRFSLRQSLWGDRQCWFSSHLEKNYTWYYNIHLMP